MGGNPFGNRAAGSQFCGAVPVTGPIEGSGGVELEIVRSTGAFRLLARRRVFSSDRVLEIGCCRGHTTEVLAERAQEVLALDNASDMVQIACKRMRKPSVHIERMDVLEDPAWLRMLGERVPAFTVVFVDIGGNRRLEHVMQLVKLLKSCMLHVRYTAVKSEALVEALQAAPEVSCRAAWWEDFLERDHSCKKRPLRPMEVIMMHPVRKTPDGREICRFANYGVCRKGDACAWAHSHCHCCGATGHFAHTCSLLTDQRSLPKSSLEGSLTLDSASPAFFKGVLGTLAYLVSRVCCRPCWGSAANLSNKC